MRRRLEAIRARHLAAQPPVYLPQSQELPVALAVNLVLARSDDVVVTLPLAMLSTAGLELSIRAVARHGGDRNGVQLAGPPMALPGTDAAPPFLFGAVYADGRRADNVDARRIGPPDAPSDPTVPRLTFQGGGTQHSGRVSVVSYFLTPAPERGDLTLVTAWPHHDLRATQTIITAAQLDDARSKIVTLWPEHGRPLVAPTRWQPRL